MPTRLERSHPERSVPSAGWSIVGWQGVTARVPADWSPVAVSSEGETGYMRIASSDSLVLEIKWEQPRKIVSVPDALERYLTQLRRAARKNREVLTIKERPRALAGLRPASQAPLPYTWHSTPAHPDAGGPGSTVQRRACGVVWHCGICNRMVIAEVLAAAGDDLSLAPEMLRGIEEHGRDGRITWAMYGLAAEVPEDYRLERHQLMSGYLKFAFRRRGATFQVERWGLANVVLKEVSAHDWFLGRERQRLSRYRLRSEEREWRGHRILHLTGAERLLPGAARAMQSLLALTLPALHFHGYVWHCPESNRIFALTGQEAKQGSVTREVFERFACHEHNAPG